MSSSSMHSSQSITSNQVNTAQLERLLCYQSGYLRYDQSSIKKSLVSFGTTCTPFRNAGAFLPFLVNHQHYTTILGADDKATINSVEDLLTKHGKPIKVTSIEYAKPIAVIYNPVCGSKTDVRSQIQKALRKNSIEAEFFETKYHMHAWDLAEKELDMTKYNAIAAVGGDGTFHQVVNGLMNRKDEAAPRPPLALLPNGTGNDLLANFGVNTLEQALEVLVKGETIKMDCNLVTLDAESSSEVPEDQGRDRVRYSLANSAFGFVANVNKKASGLKSYVGRLAYSITGLKELLLNFKPIPKYDLVLEQPRGSNIHISNLESLFVMVNNGKFAGGLSNFTPGALLNDGLLDIVYKEGNLNMLVTLKLLDQASRQQGNHVFREDVSSFRAKSVLLTARDHPLDEVQLLQVDGENLEYRSFVKIEAVPGAVDIIADCRRVMAMGPMLHSEASKI